MVALVVLLSLLNVTSVKASTQGSTVLSTKTISLTPLECKATGQARGCIITATLVKNPTPTNTSTVQTSSWWNYASYSIYECSGYGCWFYKDTLSVTVEYNFSYVYNLSGSGPGCTPSGYEIYTTYCGYWYNGGNPYGYIDYIDNFNTCTAPGNIGCFSHGLRLDIWKNGTVKDWYGF